MRLSGYPASVAQSLPQDTVGEPILVCLLGNFLLLKAGQPVVLRPGGKAEILLGRLALQHDYCVPRASLLQLLWPDADVNLAGQSLHSLVYSLRKLVGDAIGGAMPVLHDEGCYRLNGEAGVRVDIARFDDLVKSGDQQLAAGDLDAASQSYRHAADLYRGDLCIGADTQAIVERERLRARYLTVLAHLADYHYDACDYHVCLEYAWRLLARDPCREDAHRLVMQCHVRQGERAAALHHYRLCQEILRVEFDAAPEEATTRLFEQIRLEPGQL